MSEETKLVRRTPAEHQMVQLLSELESRLCDHEKGDYTPSDESASPVLRAVDRLQQEAIRAQVLEHRLALVRAWASSLTVHDREGLFAILEGKRDHELEVLELHDGS